MVQDADGVLTDFQRAFGGHGVALVETDIFIDARAEVDLVEVRPGLVGMNDIGDGRGDDDTNPTDLRAGEIDLRGKIVETFREDRDVREERELIREQRVGAVRLDLLKDGGHGWNGCFLTANGR